MAEYTLEQKRAIAIAKAKAKVAAQPPTSNSNDPSIPQPMPTVSPAMPPFLQGEKADQSYQSPIWPVSRSPEGNTSFDSNVGILGAIKSGLKVPGDVMTGKLDLNSPEATPRLLEAASLMSPLGVKARAGGAKGLVESLVAPKPKIPTTKELKAASAAGYKQADDLGIEYQGPAIQSWALKTIDELNAKSQIAENYPKVHNLLNKLANPKRSAADIPGTERISLGIVGELYKELGRLAGDPIVAKASAARNVQKSLDDFHQNLTPADMAAGNATPQAAAAIVREARANRAAAFRSETMSDLEQTVQRRASAAGSGRNWDNQTRSKLASLLESRKGSRGLNDAEKQAIDDVIKGRPTQNVMRFFGNLFGGGGGIMSTAQMMTLGGAGSYAFGPAGVALGALPPMLGAGFRGTANKMAKGETKRLGEMFRSRSPLAQKRNVEPIMLRTPDAPAPSGVPQLPGPAGTPMTSWPKPTGPVVKGALLGMQQDRTPPVQKLLNPSQGMTEQQIRLLLARGGA